MFGEIAIALPLVLWLIFRFVLPAGPYEMDHGNGTSPGTFYPLMMLYHKLFYVVGGVGLFGSMLAWFLEFGWPALYLLLAAIYAFLFNGLLLYFYEAYMTVRYPRQGQLGPSNYSLGRYATIMSLGFSSVTLLLIGVVWFAAELPK